MCGLAESRTGREKKKKEKKEKLNPSRKKGTRKQRYRGRKIASCPQTARDLIKLKALHHHHHHPRVHPQFVWVRSGPMCAQLIESSPELIGSSTGSDFAPTFVRGMSLCSQGRTMGGWKYDRLFPFESLPGRFGYVNEGENEVYW
jgi:hypothetical protein